MFNKTKRLIAAVMTAGMLLAGSTAAMAAGSPTSGNMAAEDATGVVKTVYTTERNGNHILKAVYETSKKTITVPKKVVVKGQNVKLNKIGGNAFANAKNVTKINLSSNTEAVLKNAFKGCKKLKTITYSGTKTFKVKKGAFKGLKTKKMTFKVNKKMSSSNFKKLKKALKKAGFKGKVKKVKM